jgi:hypothetical protein
MTSEVPDVGVAPLGPPIRAVASSAEPPPLRRTDPLVWIDWTGADNAAVLLVPETPAVRVRLSAVKLWVPPE